MNMPKRLIATVAVLMLGASALAQAAPPDQQGGWGGNRGDQGRGGHEQPGNGQQGHGGPSGQNWRQPPQDFGPVRQIIRDDREHFSRGAPPPRDIRIVRGQPLPHGYYGERLDGRALARLPVYHGYEWRRAGSDIVLIAIGTGLVYEVLDGVLY